MFNSNKSADQSNKKETEKAKLFNNRIKWMTVKDTAKYLGRTENAIRLLIFRGVLTSYKLGRRTYLKLSEIDEQLATSRLINGGSNGS
jgi:excisionase family DNA binding protein